jgi:hypothetical protein
MKKLFLLFSLIIALALNAQRIVIKSGSFSVLKDQTEVNVEFKFDNVLMMKENVTEEQYLENRKKDVLANPKRGEAGWQKWNGEWQRYKNEEYINYFTKGLNKSYKNISSKKANPSSKYTLLLETNWVFPGWHGGMVVMTAEITGKIKLIETNNPSNVLAEAEFNKFDKFVNNKEIVMEYGRIAGAYESLGKYLGKEIKNAVK